MGLYPPEFVRQMKAQGIAWFANVTTVSEAKAAEAAGADVIVAQGMEAGGHRGCFEALNAEAQQVGLFALLPAVVDAVRVPVAGAAVLLMRAASLLPSCWWRLRFKWHGLFALSGNENSFSLGKCAF